MPNSPDILLTSDKLLIIPDIHTKWRRAQAVLDHVLHDRVLFLGDELDAFDDTGETNRATAVWMKESLANPTHIHLMANHTHAYRFPYNVAAFCSGYTDEKALLINQVLTPEDWAKTKYYHSEQGILFTHAGVSARFLNKVHAPKTLPELVQWLDIEVPRAIEATERREFTPIFGAGYSRGGRYTTGGLIWSDHDIDGCPLSFFQCVAHTPHPSPDFLVRTPNESRLQRFKAEEMDPALLLSHWVTLDLDTHLNHYATIEDGILRVFEIAWARGEGINLTDEIGYTFQRFEGKLPVSP